MDNLVVAKFIPADKWWRRAKWELTVSIISLNKKVVVPKGFVTDGASIPLWARMLFSPTGRYFSAAIIHDYIIVTEQNWNKANDQLEAELDLLNIKSWRKNLMLFGVRLWAYFLRIIGIND